MANLFNITINDALGGDVAGVANSGWYNPSGTGATTVTDYTYDAYNLLFSTELDHTWENGNGVANPYTFDDTLYLEGVDPTIGVGLDTEANPDVISRVLGYSAGSAQYKALHSTYTTTTAMSTALKNAGISSGSVTISSDTSETAFKYYETQKEAVLDNYFYVGSTGIIVSTEAIVEQCDE